MTENGERKMGTNLKLKKKKKRWKQKKLLENQGIGQRKIWFVYRHSV